MKFSDHGPHETTQKPEGGALLQALGTEVGPVVKGWLAIL